MIKILNDKIYMTAGETCYVIGLKDGGLYADYFGARIELEDDLSALLGSSEVKEFAPEISSGNRKIKLEYVGAEVIAQKPHRASALDGGKTIVLSLRSDDGKVTAEVYYTPYPRGGLARRVIITNGTDRSIKLKKTNALHLSFGTDIVSVTSDGEIVESKWAEPGKSRCVDNFIAAASDNGAYGFLSVYGDGAIAANASDGATEIDCRELDCITVAAGSNYMSPEVLAVYSRSGIDGCRRIFHDIIRESLGGKFLSERRPVVLFCPRLSRNKLANAAIGALELGCDVFAVDIGAADINTLEDVSKACKAAGIKFGFKLNPFEIEKQSAVFGMSCAKNDAGMYEYDLAADNGVAELLELLENAIRKCDAEYLMIDYPCGGVQDFARGVYVIRHTLRQEFGELYVEWGIVPDNQRYGRLLCYPPCMIRSAVAAGRGSLKSAFDKATFGCLGYNLDPSALSDDIKRAIRAQIFSYQNDAPIVMLGDVYRIDSDTGDVCLMSVTKDKSKAYVVCERFGRAKSKIKLVGLDEHNLYNVRELNKTFSGAALISCGIPLIDAETMCLHIRQVADYE